MKIDDKDQKIIEVLIKDARLSYRQIARQLKISAATAMKRVHHLEKEKIIKGYSALVDNSKLGYDVEVLISVKIAKGKFLELWKKFLIVPEIKSIYDTTGDFDAVLIATFKNTKSLDSYLKKLQSFDYIERTHTVLILKTVK